MQLTLLLRSKVPVKFHFDPLTQQRWRKIELNRILQKYVAILLRIQGNSLGFQLR